MLNPLYAQEEDSSKFIKPIYLATGEASFYTGSMLVLNQAWYTDYEQTSFHWFNDNNEWMQMDKIGHGWSVYQASRINSWLYRQAGLSKDKADLLGTGIALLAISSIELFDGFSTNWGASPGDLLANTLGAGLYYCQSQLFDKQIAKLKYSYKPTDYPEIRPKILGSTTAEQILKDYNAQTYWLSVAFNDIYPTKILPDWVCLSAGYGADGMTGGSKNPVEYKHIERQRQFYLSLDVDWEQIETKRKGLKILFKALNMVKIPFPVIEFNRSGSKFHIFH